VTQQPCVMTASEVRQSRSLAGLAEMTLGRSARGWPKTIGCFRKTRIKGQARTQLAVHLVAAAYNLLRMAKLMTAPA